jgi:hypothetical protein
MGDEIRLLFPDFVSIWDQALSHGVLVARPKSLAVGASSPCGAGVTAAEKIDLISSL